MKLNGYTVHGKILVGEIMGTYTGKSYWREKIWQISQNQYIWFSVYLWILARANGLRFAKFTNFSYQNFPVYGIHLLESGLNNQTPLNIRCLISNDHATFKLYLITPSWDLSNRSLHSKINTLKHAGAMAMKGGMSVNLGKRTKLSTTG